MAAAAGRAQMAAPAAGAVALRRAVRPGVRAALLCQAGRCRAAFWGGGTKVRRSWGAPWRGGRERGRYGLGVKLLSLYLGVCNKGQPVGKPLKRPVSLLFGNGWGIVESQNDLR